MKYSSFPCRLMILKSVQFSTNQNRVNKKNYINRVRTLVVTHTFKRPQVLEVSSRDNFYVYSMLCSFRTVKCFSLM